MTREEFLNLQEADQDSFLAAADINNKNVIDLTAERDSLKTENEKLSGSVKALTEELKKTKETNYTLARHIDTSEQGDPDKILNELFR